MECRHRVVGPNAYNRIAHTVLAVPGQNVPDVVYDQWEADSDIHFLEVGEELPPRRGQADVIDANEQFDRAFGGDWEPSDAEEADLDENDEVNTSADAEATEALDLEALKARAVELGINPGNSKAETLAAKIAEAEAAAGGAGD